MSKKKAELQIKKVIFPPGEGLKWTPQTPEGCEIDRLVRKAIASGKAGPQSAAAASVSRSYAVCVKPILEATDSGVKFRQNAKHGREERHKAKEEEWATYQAKVTGLRTAHPDWSKSEVIREAAAKCECSESTIKRRTRDQGPKRSWVASP